ncbi:MAG: hypothetical protein CMB64_04925 [Euryarchaeota archaeon]|nr:hypothetical protein [Euryarchaeota archaeon]|tara:strand:- start:1271 stop:1537 length:267 start_codon:yes stop_codon:yes gene_type:complete
MSARAKLESMGPVVWKAALGVMYLVGAIFFAGILLTIVYLVTGKRFTFADRRRRLLNSAMNRRLRQFGGRKLAQSNSRVRPAVQRRLR